MSKSSFTFRGTKIKTPLLGVTWGGDVQQHKDLETFKTVQTPGSVSLLRQMNVSRLQVPANVNYCFRLNFCLAADLQGDQPISAVFSRMVLQITNGPAPWVHKAEAEPLHATPTEGDNGDGWREHARGSRGQRDDKSGRHESQRPLVQGTIQEDTLILFCKK